MLGWPVACGAATFRAPRSPDREVKTMRTQRKPQESVPILALAAMILLVVSGCTPEPPNAPENLTKDDTPLCKVSWTDNSTNEQGFNVYVGGSCADCGATTAWTKSGTVGSNETAFSWQETCCDVAECSCAVVRAFIDGAESDNSNIINLAPVC